MGLQPETIVSRLSLKLGGRLAHCEDSYRKIGTSEGRIDIIRNGYKPTCIKSAPQQRVAAHNPTISTKASNVLDTEVAGLLKKAAICEVDWVQGEYVSSYFAVPKSKRSPDKWRPFLNLKSSINTFVMYISAWKNLKLSGNGSSRAPCVWVWISRMPSSMSPWVPRSRNPLCLHGGGKYMNGKFYHLILNVLHKYWHIWWLLFLSFSCMTLQIKQDAGVRRLDPCDSLGIHVLWLINKLGEDNFGTDRSTSSSWFPLGHFENDYHLDLSTLPHC